MKRIKLYQENSEPIQILDDDDTDLDSYTRELTSIFEISKVTILKTSHGQVVVRPHKITSIEVVDVESNKTSSIQQDTITDGEK